MVEQPNTDEIRAEVEQWGEALAGHWIWALCDALDAARAERDDQERWTARANANTLEQRLRAEAAEAKLAAFEDCDDECIWKARIAAALVKCESRPGSDADHYLAPVRRALTEGTGQ